MSETDAKVTESAQPQQTQPVEVENVVNFEVGAILEMAQKCWDEQRRFLTATCLDMGDNFDVYYHFTDGIGMVNYKMSVPKSTEVPSISSIYLCAFLIENEMKELFGLNVQNIAIDYGGHLFLTEDMPLCPMAKYTEK